MGATDRTKGRLAHSRGGRSHIPGHFRPVGIDKNALPAGDLPIRIARPDHQRPELGRPHRLTRHRRQPGNLVFGIFRDTTPGQIDRRRCFRADGFCAITQCLHQRRPFRRLLPGCFLRLALPLGDPRLQNTLIHRLVRGNPHIPRRFLHHSRKIGFGLAQPAKLARDEIEQVAAIACGVIMPQPPLRPLHPHHLRCLCPRLPFLRIRTQRLTEHLPEQILRPLPQRLTDRINRRTRARPGGFASLLLRRTPGGGPLFILLRQCNRDRTRAGLDRIRLFWRGLFYTGLRRTRLLCAGRSGATLSHCGPLLLSLPRWCVIRIHQRRQRVPDRGHIRNGPLVAVMLKRLFRPGLALRKSLRGRPVTRIFHPPHGIDDRAANPRRQPPEDPRVQNRLELFRIPHRDELAAHLCHLVLHPRPGRGANHARLVHEQHEPAMFGHIPPRPPGLPPGKAQGPQPVDPVQPLRRPTADRAPEHLEAPRLPHLRRRRYDPRLARPRIA